MFFGPKLVFSKSTKKNCYFIMGYPGLEPGTNRLKAEYSTIELATPLYLIVMLFFLFCNILSYKNMLLFVFKQKATKKTRQQKSLIVQL